MAVMEYLQRHPEAAVPGAKIKITYQPLQTKEQLMETVRGMVKASVDELLKGGVIAPAEGEQAPVTPAGPSEQDIDAMVANLKFFDL